MGLIDIRKAFDKTNYYGILCRLLENNINFQLVSLLEFWFSISTARVQWGNSLSKEVKLLSGIKQGGVLSPLLFSLYIDCVLGHLESSGLGCYVNKVCMNSFLYADDLIVLSISVSDLQLLIDCCASVFSKLDLQINSSKSQCLRIGPRFKAVCSNIFIDDISLDWVNESKYLGVIIKTGKQFCCNWLDHRKKFYAASNKVLSVLGSNPSINLALKIISSQCFPILTYGLAATSLSPSEVNSMSFAYNSIFAKLFNTKDSNIIKLCQYYCNILPFTYLCDFIRFKFLHKWSLRAAMSGNFDVDQLLELRNLFEKYKFSPFDSSNRIKSKVWNVVNADLRV